MADPSEKLHSARTMDDQEADARPIVAGPPPYNDPNDPDAIGRTMFDLSNEGSGGGPSQEGDPVPVATTAPASTGQSAVTTDDLDEMKKDDLMAKAEELEIAGRSSMNKNELKKAIEQAMSDEEEEATKEELYERATELEIEGRSTMDKEELADAIEKAEADGGGNDG